MLCVCYTCNPKLFYKQWLENEKKNFIIPCESKYLVVIGSKCMIYGWNIQISLHLPLLDII